MKRFLALVVAVVFVFGARAEDKKAPGEQPLARFALLSDPHVNRATNGMDATFKPHFEEAIAAVKAEKVDFVLIAGDLTQEGKPEEMADFKDYIKRFDCPVWYVPGNHDVGHKFNSGKAEGTVTEDRVQTYEETLGPSFFVHEKSGVRIIGFNASILGTSFPRENDMWQFLEKELAKPSSTPTILFSHYPLFLKKSDEAGGVYWNIEPEPRAHLLKLAKQAGVKTILSAHLHRPLENRHDGILFFGTAPISFGLPRGKQPEGWTLVTISKKGDATMEFRRVEP